MGQLIVLDYPTGKAHVYKNLSPESLQTESVEDFLTDQGFDLCDIEYMTREDEIEIVTHG